MISLYFTPAISNSAISNISLYRTIFPVPYHKSVFISNFSLLYPEKWPFCPKNEPFVPNDPKKNYTLENFGSIKSAKIILLPQNRFKRLQNGYKWLFDALYIIQGIRGILTYYFEPWFHILVDFGCIEHSLYRTKMLAPCVFDIASVNCTLITLITVLFISCELDIIHLPTRIRNEL